MINSKYATMLKVVLSFLFLIGYSILQNTKTDSKPSTNLNENQIQSFYWGVDSASVVDKRFYQCIVENYGKPATFGRYLETKENVSFGLTAEEVKFLHHRGIVLMPIYNHFTNATGYERGVNEAEKAIALASDLGVEEGVYIFADIEPTYPVDSAFIEGWINEFTNSSYMPGLYGVFQNGTNVSEVYGAVSEDLRNQVAIWSSSAAQNVTSKGERPTFQPKAPDNIKVDIWQYGIDGDACNIDTNLVRGEMIDQLW